MQKEMINTEDGRKWACRYTQLGKILGKLGKLGINNWGIFRQEVEKISTDN